MSLFAHISKPKQPTDLLMVLFYIFIKEQPLIWLLLEATREGQVYGKLAVPSFGHPYVHRWRGDGGDFPHMIASFVAKALY